MAGLPFPNYSISKHLSQINKWWALKPAKQNTISFYFLKLPEGPPDPLLLHRASKCNSSYIRAQKLPSNRSTVTTSQQFIHVKPRASTLCQISLLDERWSIAQWLAVARLAKEAIFGVTTDLNHKSTALFVHWVHVVFPLVRTYELYARGVRCSFSLSLKLFALKPESILFIWSYAVSYLPDIIMS